MRQTKGKDYEEKINEIIERGREKFPTKTLNSYILIDYRVLESGFMNALKIKMVQHTNSICN